MQGEDAPGRAQHPSCGEIPSRATASTAAAQPRGTSLSKPRRARKERKLCHLPPPAAELQKRCGAARAFRTSDAITGSRRSQRRITESRRFQRRIPLPKGKGCDRSAAGAPLRCSAAPSPPTPRLTDAGDPGDTSLVEAKPANATVSKHAVAVATGPQPRCLRRAESFFFFPPILPFLAAPQRISGDLCWCKAEESINALR